MIYYIKKFVFFSLLLVFIFNASSLKLNAQQCYAPMTGDNIEIGVNTGSGICVTQLCLGGYYNNLQLVKDNNLNSYTVWGNLVSALSAQGLFLRDTVNVYPAGYVAGFLLEQIGLTSISLLNDLTITTYLNGVPRETKSVGNNLLSGNLLAGSEKFFATFTTTLSFNEIRLNTSLLSVGLLNGLRVYSGFAFDANCNLEDNQVCVDYIQGPGTHVSYNGSLACVLCNLTNPNNLIDANKNNYAGLTLPVAALANVSVGVIDLRNTYPAGSRAGFVIEPEGATLLNLELLEMMTIQTYLFGELQESHTYSTSSSSVLNLKLLGGSGNKKQKLGFETTEPFNEVRLVVDQPVSVNLGTIRIHGAFEEPPNCSDCEEFLKTTQAAPYTASVVTGGGSQWTGNYGIVSTAIQNPDRVIDVFDTNYAQITAPLISLLGGARVTYQTADTFPTGTYAGFTIEKSSGLIDLGLFQSITIKAYNGNTLVDSETGTSLLGASVLSGNSGQSRIGFYPSGSFNRIMIDFNFGLLGLGVAGSNYRIYNAFVIEDTDGDGTADCYDMCANGSDAFDSNGDGIPDDCSGPFADINTINVLESPDTSFMSGDTLIYKVTVSNLGNHTAEDVNIVNFAPQKSDIISWTATASGTTVPNTSGTGDIDETIDTMPNGSSVEYLIVVVTHSDFKFPEIKNEVSVTSSTEDPDPTCPSCITPGLPRVETPDLILFLDMPFTSFTQTINSQNLILNVQEIDAVNTNDSIVLFVTKFNGMSIDLDTTLTSFNSGLGSIPVDNPNWKIDSSSNPIFHLIYSKPSFVIPENGVSKIGISMSIDVNAINASSAIILYYIKEFSGGERNFFNNATDIMVSLD